MASGSRPVTSLLFDFGAVTGSSLLLRVWPLLHIHLLLIEIVLEKGWCPPLEL